MTTWPRGLSAPEPHENQVEAIPLPVQEASHAGKARSPRARVASILVFQAEQMKRTAQHMAAVLSDDEAMCICAAQLQGAAECVALWAKKLQE